MEAKMAAVNKKLKHIILQQVNVISLLLLQKLATIEKNVDYMENLKFSSQFEISSRFS